MMNPNAAPSSPRRHAAWVSRWVPVLLALLVVAVCAANAGLLRERVALVAYPWAIDQEEEWLLVHLQWLLRGESWIRPLGESFVVATYHPLALLLTAPLAERDAATLAPGRAIAVAHACMAAAMLALVAAILAGSAALGAACGAVWLLSRDTLSWLPYFRVDFVALAWGWTALAVFALTSVARPRRGPVDLVRVGLMTATLCGVAALFAKQTMVAPLAAIGCAVAWRSPRSGAAWGALTAACIGAVMVVLEATSPGSYWFHAVTANANVFSGWQLQRWLLHFGRFQPILIVGAFLIVAAALVAGRRAVPAPTASAGDDAPPAPARGDFERACLIYAALGLLAFAGVAKLGAAENYMLEPNGALLLLLAWGGGRLRCGALRAAAASPASDPARPLAPLAGALLACLAPFLLLAHAESLFARPWFARQIDAPMVTLGLKQPAPADFDAAVRAFRWASQRPEATYADRPLVALRAGAPVMLHPFIMAQLAREGKWDEEDLFARWGADPPWQVIVTHDLRADASLSADAPFTPRFQAWLNEGYLLKEIAAAPLFTYHRWVRRAPVPVAAGAASSREGPMPAAAAARRADLPEVRLTPSDGAPDR